MSTRAKRYRLLIFMPGVVAPGPPAFDVMTHWLPSTAAEGQAARSLGSRATSFDQMANSAACAASRIVAHLPAGAQHGHRP